MPVRHSLRGQPRLSELPKESIYDYSWVEEEIFRASTDSRDFGVFNSRYSKKELEALETCYHNSFVRVPRAKTPKASKKHSKSQEAQRFETGNTVIVRTDGSDTPGVAVITAIFEVIDPTHKLSEDHDLLGMHIRLHWFLRADSKYMPNSRVRRQCEKNEVYYTTGQQRTISPDLITGHCRVYSLRDAAPRQSKVQPAFITRYSINPQNGSFSDFEWAEHCATAMLNHRADLRDDSPWSIREPESFKTSSRTTRRNVCGSLNKQIDSDDGHYTDESQDGVSDYDVGDTESQTSEDEVAYDSAPEMEIDTSSGGEGEERIKSKKRKKPGGSSKSSPKKSNPTKASGVPRSDNTRRGKNKTRSQRRFNIRPMASLTSSSSSKLPRDPFNRVIHALHVGSRPEVLSCREEEYADILGAVLGMLEDGCGGCIYISGVPGTGKTATVYAAVKELKEMAARGESSPFTYVEINGLKLPDPPSAYRLLWEAVSHHDTENEGHLSISNKQAFRNLIKYFADAKGGSNPGNHTCVVLMDELDQLMTAKQDVVYNFFNWPSMTETDVNLIVIAVANTHDLPERAMTGRVRSRIGMTRINFKPYGSEQLIKIVQRRLENAQHGLQQTLPRYIDEDAIKFASMKVASISGDARRVLDICRRAVEVAYYCHQESGSELKAARIPEVKKVIDAMQNSPTAAFLVHCSEHERIMLAAALKCIRKNGTETVRWGELVRQHMIYSKLLPNEGDSTRTPTKVELKVILRSLASSRALLVEEGAAAMRKGEEERKIMLLVEPTEVERVLGEVGGERWKSTLGAGML